MGDINIKGFKSPSILREGFRMGTLCGMKINFIVVFFFQISAIICQNNNTNDYQALRAIYLSTNGDNWTVKKGWPSSEEFILNLLPPPNTDYSKWHGVYCVDGRVIGLWFKENNLTGVLPEEIGNLTELTDIIIEGSPIGGEIPSSIGKIKKLNNLQLYNNKFSGKIPKELYELYNLSRLDLRRNKFSSKIPKELEKLKSLILLDLAYNEFSGKIPSELGNIKTLKVLRIDNNQLIGKIPSSFGSLSELTNLYVENNKLSGKIPIELFQLKKLQYFDFDGNKLDTSSIKRFKEVRGEGY